jgi:hypothetical protein
MEVEEFRQIGLDLSKVRHQDDIEQDVSRWANTDSPVSWWRCLAAAIPTTDGLSRRHRVGARHSSTIDAACQAEASRRFLPTTPQESRLILC